MTSASGVLALWHDSAPGHEATFEDWYQTEHLYERLGLPGFLRGRRYELAGAEAAGGQNAAGNPAFFTCYEVTGPAVLRSDAYLARTAAPTALTRQVMTSGAVRNMSRTVCRIAGRRGAYDGSHAVTAVLRSGDAAGRHDAALDSLARDVGIARIDTWVREDGVREDGAREDGAREDGAREDGAREDGVRAEASVEEKLRGADDRIEACIVIETLRYENAARIARTCRALFGEDLLRLGVYRFLCALGTDGARP